MDERTVTFYAEVKFETDFAYLLNDGENDFWIPKSQVIEKVHVSDDDYEFEIPEWLAIEKEVV